MEASEKIIILFAEGTKAITRKHLIRKKLNEKKIITPRSIILFPFKVNWFCDSDLESATYAQIKI